MKRFNKIKKSKFKKITPAEMGAVKGGLCISCRKRARKVEVSADKKLTGIILHF